MKKANEKMEIFYFPHKDFLNFKKIFKNPIDKGNIFLYNRIEK